MTYYRKLSRNLTGHEERRLNSIVASYTGNPNAGIGAMPTHDKPRIWLADCSEDLAEQLDHYLFSLKLIRTRG